MPESGAIVTDLDDPEIREIYFGNYRIIYHYAGKHVTVLTVFHGARLLDVDELLKQVPSDE